MDWFEESKKALERLTEGVLLAFLLCKLGLRKGGKMPKRKSPTKLKQEIERLKLEIEIEELKAKKKKAEKK